MKNHFRGWGILISLVVLSLLFTALLNLPSGQNKKVYSDLVKAIQAGQVKELTITENRAVAVLENEARPMEVSIPSVEILYENAGKELDDLMRADKLKFDTPMPFAPPWWVQLLYPLGFIILIILIWTTFQQAQSGGGRGAMSFGRSRAKLNIDDKKRVTFADVAGADEEKEELKELVDFLRAPEKFRELGARIPKGVLLVGPPGTGKTLLAKAVSGEAGVPFFTISGSDFVEMFVGVGASRVRDLFEQAKKHAPCIIFIDEIDAVGRHRGAGLGGGHDEREQTLNQLLVEMDGFGVNEGVIVIAATNRPDILDPALLRPGRFDRQVTVAPPDVKGREEVLAVHSRGKPLADDVDLSTIAKGTVGFTGADLENLMNEAALLSARNGKKVICMPEIEEAILKVVMGPEKKSRVKIERERNLTAYHEAGHAVVSKFLPTQDPVHQVSILPRGNAGGYTLQLPKEDKSYVSKTEMKERIIVLLGGRVAEKLALDDISTGASNDIERATDIATKMVTKYGMSDNLGTMTFGQTQEEVFLGKDYGHAKNYSEHIAAQIDNEVKAIIDECYKKCQDILVENRDKLDKIAQVLLEKEKIDADEFKTFFA